MFRSIMCLFLLLPIFFVASPHASACSSEIITPQKSGKTSQLRMGVSSEKQENIVIPLQRILTTEKQFTNINLKIVINSNVKNSTISLTEKQYEQLKIADKNVTLYLYFKDFQFVIPLNSFHHTFWSKRIYQTNESVIYSLTLSGGKNVSIQPKVMHARNVHEINELLEFVSIRKKHAPNENIVAVIDKDGPALFLKENSDAVVKTRKAGSYHFEKGSVITDQSIEGAFKRSKLAPFYVPNKEVSRAELAMTLAESTNIQANICLLLPTVDVDEEMQKMQLFRLAQHFNYIRSDEKNLYRPNALVTRAEVAVAFVQFLEHYNVRPRQIFAPVVLPKDAEREDGDTQAAIQTMIAYQIFQVDEENNFHPQKVITHNELLDMLTMLYDCTR
ncbi:MAG: S-layer homology domain-containing protein [Bacilli bacterium]